MRLSAFLPLLVLLAAGRGCSRRILLSLSGPGLLMSTSRMMDDLIFDDIFEEVTPLREQVQANLISEETHHDLETLLLVPKLLAVGLTGWTARLSVLHLVERRFVQGLLFGALALESFQVSFNCSLRRYRSLVLARGYKEPAGLHFGLLLEGTWLEAANRAMGRLLSRLSVTPHELLLLRWHERGCDPLDWNCVI